MSEFTRNGKFGRRGSGFFSWFCFDVVQVDCHTVVLVFDQKVNVEEIIVKVQVVSQVVGFGVCWGSEREI